MFGLVGSSRRYAYNGLIKETEKVVVYPGVLRFTASPALATSGSGKWCRLLSTS